MGEKIKLVILSLCIYQRFATLLGMAYGSTTMVVQYLDRSPEITVLSRPVTALSDVNASYFNSRILPVNWWEDLITAAAISLSHKSVQRTEAFHSDSGRRRRNFQQQNPTIDNPQPFVSIAGALAMAGDSVEAANFGYQKVNNSENLSLVCEQLRSSTFEAANIESKARRDKEFWKAQNRQQKILNLMAKASNSTSLDELGSIAWPRYSRPFPRSWCNRRNLRVKRKNVTCSGIDEFMANLEFTSFRKPIKEMAATYNDLVYQVYAMNFDTLGDVAVIDSTLPFRKPDPTEDEDNWSAMGVNHWLLYIYFFAFIGSVVWILVRLLNKDLESQTRPPRTSL